MVGAIPKIAQIRLRGGAERKIYMAGTVKVPALEGIDLTIDSGEFLSIMGPSEIKLIQ
ncbi:MAG: hypothetical protein ACLQPD_26885 [Desulfomonilaceae bacterium]